LWWYKERKVTKKKKNQIADEVNIFSCCWGFIL